MVNIPTVRHSRPHMCSNIFFFFSFSLHHPDISSLPLLFSLFFLSFLLQGGFFQLLLFLLSFFFFPFTVGFFHLLLFFLFPFFFFFFSFFLLHSGFFSSFSPLSQSLLQKQIKTKAFPSKLYMFSYLFFFFFFQSVLSFFSFFFFFLLLFLSFTLFCSGVFFFFSLGLVSFGILKKKKSAMSDRYETHK